MLFGSEPTVLLIFLLGTLELTHSIAHTLVLFGWVSVTPHSLFRKIYFSSDLLTVGLSYYFFQTNVWLVLIHLLIHLGAVQYLFFRQPSNPQWKLFHHIFEMAENRWRNQRQLTIIIYVGGT